MIYIFINLLALLILNLSNRVLSQGSSSSNTGEVSGYCFKTCNDLKSEILSLTICREAKRTLPRPKVGDYCSIAMEQAFNDVCQPLCMFSTPVGRISQTCRGAAMEMPRPTVLKWCEHGYKTAYELAYSKLFNRFNDESIDSFDEAQTYEEDANIISEEINEETVESRNIRYRIPVTVEDKAEELLVYENQDVEEAVVVFCKINNPDNLNECLRQLLPTVIESINSL